MTRCVAAAIVSAVLVASGSASAQEVRGFAAAGIMRTVNAETHPVVGGGATVDLGTPWLSAGGQAETFFSWPYFGGRGAVFGQMNILPKGPIRALAIVGAGFGEDAGPLIGGGVEFRPAGQRLGGRITVEDYLTSVTPFVCPTTGAACGFASDRRAHQLAVRAGILF